MNLSLLSITYTENEVPYNGIIYRSASIYTKTIEPAGRGYDPFVSRYLKRQQYSEEKDYSIEEEVEEEIDAENADHINMDKMKKKKLNKTIHQIKNQDLYEILDLHDDIDELTENQIKKAYKRLAVIYHPDKYTEETYTDEAKEKWLRVRLLDHGSV